MIRPTILVIKIIGVLPDIEGKERNQALFHGVVRTCLLGDLQHTIRTGRQPHPAAAEKPRSLGLELLLESFEAAPLLFNLGSEVSRRSVVRLRRLELREIEVVVQDLPGVVEQGTIGLTDDYLQFHSFEGAAREQVVQVIHIALQVLAVVERQGLGRNDRCQSVRCIWEVDERKHTVVYFLCEDTNFSHNTSAPRSGEPMSREKAFC